MIYLSYCFFPSRTISRIIYQFYEVFLPLFSAFKKIYSFLPAFFWAYIFIIFLIWNLALIISIWIMKRSSSWRKWWDYYIADRLNRWEGKSVDGDNKAFLALNIGSWLVSYTVLRQRMRNLTELWWTTWKIFFCLSELILYSGSNY